MDELELRGSGSVAIFAGEERVSQWYGSRGKAISAIAGVDRRRRSRERPCITCQAPFKSMGPGHRMCNACRAIARQALT